MKESLPAHNSRLPRILLIAMLSAFMLGVVQLFLLRFEKGDVYPAYSSFRADPLGAKAFFLALKETPGVNVHRNHYAFKKLRPDRETVLLYLGAAARPGFVRSGEATALDRFVKGGGRICVSFRPSRGWVVPPGRAKMPGDGGEAKQPVTADPPAREKGSKEDPPARLTDLWGFAFDFDGRHPADGYARPVEAAAGARSAAGVLWHSGVYFADLGPDWKVVYQRAGKPVIIEKAHGLGSILMAGDTYFISNEALRAERHPELLARILSGRPAVIFDEFHFGIRSQSGLVGLLFKYRLQGVFLSILVCLGLFVWKRTAWFVPPAEQPAREAGHYLSTRDYATGLTSLLRRNISTREIFDACVAEWEKSFTAGRRPSVDMARKLKQIQMVADRKPSAAAGRKDPVARYNRICQILSEKKHHEQSH